MVVVVVVVVAMLRDKRIEIWEQKFQDLKVH